MSKARHGLPRLPEEMRGEAGGRNGGGLGVEAGEGRSGVRCCRKLQREHSPPVKAQEQKPGGAWAAPAAGWGQAAPTANPESRVQRSRSLSVVKLRRRPGGTALSEFSSLRVRM